MCFGGDSSPPPTPVAPAPPPAPPPVLDQAAPETTEANKTSDTLANKATGTAKYRNSLSIGGTSTSGSSGTGLGISL